MKIVHITRKFLDGFGYQDNELAEMHSSLGHDVTVIASDSDNSSLYFDVSLTPTLSSTDVKYKVIRLVVNNKINFRFWRLKGLGESLMKIKPDLIFFHGSPMFSLPDIAKYKKKNPTVKLVMDCHNDYNNAAHSFISKEIMHKIVYRSIIQWCDKAIDLYYYLTPNIKIFMEEMYKIKEKKLSFLPRGGIVENMKINKHIELRSIIRKTLGINDGDIVIVSGGKLDFAKQTHNLCEAINRMDNNKLHLILFGSIEKSYEHHLLSSINGNPRIHSVGWVSSIDVYDYFHASDIACFPGGHSVLWEQAICCGLPLVVKDWYNGMWYLNVNDNVLLLKDSSVNEIIAKLNILLSDQELRETMALNASTKGRDFFSYKRIAQQILTDVDL